MERSGESLWHCRRQCPELPYLEPGRRFSGTTQKLECDYCGSSFAVSEIESLYAEKDEQAAAAAAAAAEKEEAAQAAAAEEGWDSAEISSDWGKDADVRAYNCPSCGAELIFDVTTAATSCPYCGNPTIVPGNLSGTLKPDYVIPFRLNKEAAVKALREYYQGKKLLPKAFASENHINEVKGVYVPFWMYDGSVMPMCVSKKEDKEYLDKLSDATFDYLDGKTDYIDMEPRTFIGQVKSQPSEALGYYNSELDAWGITAADGYTIRYTLFDCTSTRGGTIALVCAVMLIPILGITVCFVSSAKNKKKNENPEATYLPR